MSTDYRKMNAVELAEALTAIHELTPDGVANLLRLSRASVAWTLRYPQLNATYRGFARAVDQEALPAIQVAAAELAGELRKLGAIHLARCPENAIFGRCGRVLRLTGPCSAADEHVSAS
ncbi:hypothetical protein [Streptomyces buecherae]|uniref:hypothetical protein n=1 Tax=Streptomyces buecherae TaxID=2763006 RepID=UPI00164D4102|nr:hypothetical protein [Streptomyces buecherae]QNJ42005.1 hypothetical protein H7H31_21225 [Streptomyces buecherae]